MDKADVLNICSLIRERFPSVVNNVPRWRILSLIDKNLDKLIMVKDNGVIKGFSFYLKLTDDSVTKILTGDLDLTNANDLASLMNDNGDNVHFLFLVSDGMRTTLRGLKKVIQKENPYSMSYYNPSMNLKFFKYKRSELCHQ